jgi:hypothetical protein
MTIDSNILMQLTLFIFGLGILLYARAWKSATLYSVGFLFLGTAVAVGIYNF